MDPKAWLADESIGGGITTNPEEAARWIAKYPGKVTPLYAVPEFKGIAAYKLDAIQQRGWQLCGYAITDAKGNYGFVTTGALVGWWLPETYAGHLARDLPPHDAEPPK